MRHYQGYVLMRNLVQKNKFWVFNTHYDHLGKMARSASSELILTKIANINKQDHPVILMGDFNALEKELPIQLITKISRQPPFHKPFFWWKFNF